MWHCWDLGTLGIGKKFDRFNHFCLFHVSPAVRVPPVFARSGFTANPLSADVSFMLFYVCNFLFLTRNLCHRPDFFFYTTQLQCIFFASRIFLLMCCCFWDCFAFGIYAVWTDIKCRERNLDWTTRAATKLSPFIFINRVIELCYCHKAEMLSFITAAYCSCYCYCYVPGLECRRPAHLVLSLLLLHEPITGNNSPCHNMETRSQLRTWSAWCFQRCAQQIDKHWALYTHLQIHTYLPTCIHAYTQMMFQITYIYIYDIRWYTCIYLNTVVFVPMYIIYT